MRRDNRALFLVVLLVLGSAVFSRFPTVLSMPTAPVPPQASSEEAWGGTGAVGIDSTVGNREKTALPSTKRTTRKSARLSRLMVAFLSLAKAQRSEERRVGKECRS